MLIFPRKYQHSGQLFRPGTDFRSFSENSQQNGKMRIFAEKCDFFEKNHFFGVRNSISGPIAQNLLKPVLF